MVFLLLCMYDSLFSFYVFRAPGRRGFYGIYVARTPSATKITGCLVDFFPAEIFQDVLLVGMFAVIMSSFVSAVRVNFMTVLTVVAFGLFHGISFKEHFLLQDIRM